MEDKENKTFVCPDCGNPYTSSDGNMKCINCLDHHINEQPKPVPRRKMSEKIKFIRDLRDTARIFYILVRLWNKALDAEKSNLNPNEEIDKAFKEIGSLPLPELDRGRLARFINEYLDDEGVWRQRIDDEKITVRGVLDLNSLANALISAHQKGELTK